MHFQVRNILKSNGTILPTTVLKSGPAWRADSGLGPVRVEAKTRLGVGPVDPGPRPPGQTRSLIYIYIYIYIDVKRRCFSKRWRITKQNWGHIVHRANLINEIFHHNQWLGPGTGPGGGKNSLGSWPGRPRTRATRSNQVSYIYIYRR